MAKIFKLNFSQVKNILDSPKFKTLFLLILFTCIFNSFNLNSTLHYEEAILTSFTNPLFMFMLIGTTFLSTTILISSFDKNFSTILRYKNKFEYIKNLLISNVIIGIVVYMLAVSITLLILTFKYFGHIRFNNIPYYDIPFVVYNIFTILKYAIVICILSMIGCCVYKNFGKIIGYIYYVFILVVYYLAPVKTEIISEFKLENLNFKFYLAPYQYTDIFLDVVSFIIFVCVSILIISALIYATVRASKIKIDE